MFIICFSAGVNTTVLASLGTLGLFYNRTELPAMLDTFVYGSICAMILYT